MDTPISPKVAVSAAAGALVVIVVWVLELIWSLVMPVPVQGALVVILMAAAGYLQRDPLRDAGQEAATTAAIAPDTAVGLLPFVRAVVPEDV